MKILLVEDDQATIDSFKICFRLYKPQYRLTAITDGGQAMELLQKESFNLVLLDLGLPQVDGMTVLQFIHQISDVPVIIISACHDAALRSEVLTAGANQFLGKPFNFKNMLEKVEGLIQPLVQTV